MSVFMVIPALLVLALACAMAVLAAQVMAVVQGKEVSVRLESYTRTKLGWLGTASVLGYHPLSPRLWLGIIRARDLPWNAENKQRLMRINLAALIVLLLLFGGLSAYFWSNPHWG